MRLSWDKQGERLFETGVSKGVFFPPSGAGKAWNGLTAVNENPSGGESNPIYADNIKYLNIVSYEDYGITIEAYSYPEGFNECIGLREIIKGVTIGQQPKKPFGFSWRTEIGNDTEGTEHGYKLHLVFNCNAQPSEISHETANDSTEPLTYSWEVTTVPIDIGREGFKPTANMTFSSVELAKIGLYNLLAAIENVIYGNGDDDARMPKVDEILTIINQTMYLRDSKGEFILDSLGRTIQSFVID